MIKQVVAIVVLSILIISMMSYAQVGLQAILSAHQWIADTLMDIFSGGPAGNLIRQLLALLAIPMMIGLIPVIIYWLAKRSWFPYFMEVTWVVWLAQVAALVIQYKLAVAA